MRMAEGAPRTAFGGSPGEKLSALPTQILGGSESELRISFLLLPFLTSWPAAPSGLLFSSVYPLPSLSQGHVTSFPPIGDC